MKVNNLFNWPKYPNNLFTCDISRPFQISKDGHPAKFPFITAWEILEHIPPERMQQTLLNIREHCSGYLFTTISKGGKPGVDSDQHMTYIDGLKPFEWWEGQLIEARFTQQNGLLERYFPRNTWNRYVGDEFSWVNIWA
jgi:hypothetical protein